MVNNPRDSRTRATALPQDASERSPTAASDGPLYPANRTFVVQVQRGPFVDETTVRGRVEHVRSGRGRRFCGLDELNAFVRGVVTDVAGVANVRATQPRGNKSRDEEAGERRPLRGRKR